MGLLNGFITGIVFLMMLKIAEKSEGSLILRLVPKFLAIPGCWFGVPWVTGKVVPIQEFTDAYVVSLAVSFCAICLYPAARWAYHVGNKIGRNC